jgi:hypothetical protein
MKIYIIGGKAKSGKNTFGELLRDNLKEYGYKPCVMQITEPLYSYARNYFEYDMEKDEKPREFLQKMGIEIIREKLNKPNFLINRLKEDIEILSNFFDTFIITDARLENEFINLKKTYTNVTTIKIERENYYVELSESEKNHITETEIDKFDVFDYKVINSGYSSLEEQAKEIVKKENKK